MGVEMAKLKPVFASFLFALVALIATVPSNASACACGCCVFDVGTSSILPTGEGGIAYFRFNYQDQNDNRSGLSKAPGARNPDQDLQTLFYTAGFQYLFNRSWGLQVEVPFVQRRFRTDRNFASDPPNVVTTRWGDLGDVRIKGLYTGFFEDLSTGLSFGLKLPTGDYNFSRDSVDRDTQIGSGSTDLLLGAYHRLKLSSDNLWSAFAQAQVQIPFVRRGYYLPGVELNASWGVHYNGFSIGEGRISPVVQAIGSFRTLDNGSDAADPVASGYERLLASPGLEFDWDPISLYVDFEIPVVQDFRGNQLAAPFLFKAVVAYRF